MAKGKTHDRFNLVVLFLVSLWLASQGTSIGKLGIFILGWLASTWFLSPDLDLGPKKRAGLFGVLLYPYHLFFRHRGRSHHPLWGTLSRSLYLVGVWIVLCSIVHHYGLSDQSGTHAFFNALEFFKNFDLQRPTYQYFTLFFIGMLGADWSHLFLDRLFSGIKKVLG